MLTRSKQDARQPGVSPGGQSDQPSDTEGPATMLTRTRQASLQKKRLQSLPMTDTVHMGKRIADKRRDRNLSQTDLARAIGISSQAVNQWESGATKTVRPVNLLACADELRVSVRYLVTGRDPKPLTELTEPERELLEVFKQLKPEERDVLMVTAQGFIARRIPGVAAYLGTVDPERQLKANRQIEAAQRKARRRPKAPK